MSFHPIFFLHLIQFRVTVELENTMDTATIEPPHPAEFETHAGKFCPLQVGSLRKSSLRVILSCPNILFTYIFCQMTTTVTTIVKYFHIFKLLCVLLMVS